MWLLRPGTLIGVCWLCVYSVPHPAGLDAFPPFRSALVSSGQAYLNTSTPMHTMHTRMEHLAIRTRPRMYISPVSLGTETKRVNFGYVY